jgi:hypothetical protein
MKLGWFLFAAFALRAQVVEVTVLADTGAPIPGVKVELAQDGSAMRRGSTDARGVFRFDGVAEGDYSVELTCTGYRHMKGRSPRLIHAAAGANPLLVEERMLRLGNVSGRVIGGGKGIAGAEVRLLRVGDFGGLIERSGATGAFEFHDVDPGAYVLSSRPNKDSSAPDDNTGRKMGWVRTWYPSSLDASGAARLLIAGGVDLPAQDVELRAVTLQRVAGRVLSPAGDPVPGAIVKAMPPEEFQADQFELQARSGKDGAFEFAALPEGEWRLSAEVESAGVPWYVASRETVRARELEGIELRFSAPFTLAGKVVRTPTGTPAEKKRVGVILAPKVGGFHLSFSTPSDDGSFRIDNVAPGFYRFQPTSPDAPYYLASIEMGGRDVVGQYVEIAPGTLPVTITYRADGGTLHGTVEDCGGATVVLAPREPVLQYAEFIRQVKCGERGRYEIGAVRPGEYFAFAFDRSVGPLEFGTVAGQWAGQAVRVTVRAGEGTDVPLKVTQR